MTSVSEPCPPAGGATTGRSGHRGLTRQSVARKDADGPAARPTTPLAVENSVGEPAARRRPTSAHGKESVASSHPRFGPGGSKESPGPLLLTGASGWVPHFVDAFSRLFRRDKRPEDRFRRFEDCSPMAATPRTQLHPIARRWHDSNADRAPPLRGLRLIMDRRPGSVLASRAGREREISTGDVDLEEHLPKLQHPHPDDWWGAVAFRISSARQTPVFLMGMAL